MRYIHLILHILILTSQEEHVEATKFLLLGILSRSHQMEITAVGSNLAAKGHTVYNTLPEHSPQIENNVKEGLQTLTYKTPKTMVQDTEEYGAILSKMIFEDKLHAMDVGRTLIEFSQDQCKFMLNDQEFLTNIKSMKFDMAIVDAFILDYCLFVIPTVLSIPYIAMSGTLVNYWSMGIPALPSMSPSHIFCYPEQQSFFQRFISMCEHILLNSWLFPREENFIIKEHAPDFHNKRHKFLQNAQLLLITYDHHLEYPHPAMPDTIFLPGMTYLPPRELSSFYKIIIDEAKSGVILVSFGSNISGYMPKHYFVTFLEAFKNFPDYTILWKFPDKTDYWNITLPSNIHLLPWLPQNDILGHPKTKLFITHCGNNGQYESVSNGVPMIGVPLFADQFHNSIRMKYKGFGISHDIHTLTSEDLIKSMRQILFTDNSFRENVKKTSQILKSFPPPRERATEWIELILKHGDNHLHATFRDMPFYQMLMLDVLFFMFSMICMLFWVSLFIGKTVFKVYKKQKLHVDVKLLLKKVM